MVFALLGKIRTCKNREKGDAFREGSEGAVRYLRNWGTMKRESRASTTTTAMPYRREEE